VLKGSRKPVVACSVEGCNRPRKSRGFCGTHYERWRLHGDIRPSDSVRIQEGQGSVTFDGYRIFHDRNHPLADKSGQIYEHRKVLYEKIGPGIHPCTWCGIDLEWGSTLQADHLDAVRLNNVMENLVPSCKPCNTLRGQGARKRWGKSSAEAIASIKRDSTTGQFLPNA
jgi:hypothetical protein